MTPALILAVVQAATAVATDTLLGGHATQIGIGAILAINIWQVRATLAFRDEARVLRQWAFGVNGDNGANQDLKDTRDDLDDLDSEMGSVFQHIGKDRRTGLSDRRRKP